MDSQQETVQSVSVNATESIIHTQNAQQTQQQTNKADKNKVNTGPTKRTTKIVNEYDQEIPQSRTADNPVAP